LLCTISQFFFQVFKFVSCFLFLVSCFFAQSDTQSSSASSAGSPLPWRSAPRMFAASRSSYETSGSSNLLTHTADPESCEYSHPSATEQSPVVSTEHSIATALVDSGSLDGSYEHSSPRSASHSEGCMPRSHVSIADSQEILIEPTTQPLVSVLDLNDDWVIPGWFKFAREVFSFFVQ
jgi:hypothetical protein